MASRLWNKITLILELKGTFKTERHTKHWSFIVNCLFQNDCNLDIRLWIKYVKSNIRIWVKSVKTDLIAFECPFKTQYIWIYAINQL